MIQTQLVFKNEYRFDLKKVEFVIIPYLFNNDASLIITAEIKTSKSYKSLGRIDQSLIDYPGKLIASSQVLQIGNQEIEFPQKGRFQLLFYPNYYLGRTTVKILKLIPKTKTVIPFNIQASTESVILLAANPSRLGATFLNKSDSVLYIDFETEAQNNIEAVEVFSGGYYEMPFGYTGIVYGRWGNATQGIAIVREFV
ncbi:hypothetical protein NIES4075_34440 [Tolypothrix sp. NIES-4075]|uniref:hypothetical protein n=1 Tax=Tolypothrix sp. NIES-4075 TaxID=2005459 RepID=UPI000B70BEC2|nr:hypothetical protein [Tolypothrix sp. NIES-4075]GAX42443.1 hypothetical protein NIES4075_34440 [Tolypothrix sp. NIES-4075]